MQKISILILSALMLMFSSCRKSNVVTATPVVTPPPQPSTVLYDTIFIANSKAGGGYEWANYEGKLNSVSVSAVSSNNGGFGKCCFSLDNKYRYQVANAGAGGYGLIKTNFNDSAVGTNLITVPSNFVGFQAWEAAAITGTNKLVLKCFAGNSSPQVVGSEDIFTCNDDGTGLTKITAYSNAGNATQTFLENLAVNSTGTKLSYVKYKGVTTSMVIINTDGSNELTLLSTPNLSFASYISPCFSKDNSKVYYVNSNNQVCSINTDGTGNTVLFIMTGLPVKKLCINKSGTAFYIAQGNTTSYSVKKVDINGANEILVRNTGLAFAEMLVQN